MTLREKPDLGKRGISQGGNWFKRFEEGAGQATLCARNYEPSSRAGTKGVRDGSGAERARSEPDPEGLRECFGSPVNEMGTTGGP